MHLLSCHFKGSYCHTVTHLTDTRGQTTTTFKAMSFTLRPSLKTCSVLLVMSEITFTNEQIK